MRLHTALQRSRFAHGHCHKSEDPLQIILALRLRIAVAVRLSFIEPVQLKTRLVPLRFTPRQAPPSLGDGLPKANRRSGASPAYGKCDSHSAQGAGTI